MVSSRYSGQAPAFYLNHGGCGVPGYKPCSKLDSRLSPLRPSLHTTCLNTIMNDGESARGWLALHAMPGASDAMSRKANPVTTASPAMWNV